jgi:hypothetical protein
MQYMSRPSLKARAQKVVVVMRMFHLHTSRLFSGHSLLFAAALIVASPVMEHAAAVEELEPIIVVPGRARQMVSLRDRLVVGLQARLKSEVAFVEVVVARVRTGHLPQRMVDETFFWARQRAADRRTGRPRRPIIFFQPAMQARANRLPVEL